MAAAAEFPDEFPFQPDQNAGNPIGVGKHFIHIVLYFT